MKKLLLSLSFALFSYLGFAQVTFYVDPPSGNSGNYTNTYTDPAGGDWSVPDMTDPANAVTGELALAIDSLGCVALTNGAAIAGKIAVIYRGGCEFGLKALNAQNEGAIAVVLVNHTGDPVGMGGGADGINVTIPVIMISEQTGALIHDEIVAGGLTCFIGNKNGFYANDIGIGQKDVLRAKQFSSIQALSQDATEFNVETGAWVFNFGSNDQVGIEVGCFITFGGAPIYTQVSAPLSILSGDSTFVSFPAFSQPVYANGYYTMNYSVASAVADEFPADNDLNADFNMSENLFTYCRVDPVANEPITNSGFYAGTQNIFSACVQFSDPNASRMGVKGLTFAASTSVVNDGVFLDGKLLNIEAYKWNDAITDLNDAGFTMDALELLTTGEYAYDLDLQNEMVSTLFDEPFLLEDNQHYLFCVTSYDNEISVGSDTKLDYDENIDNVTSPSSNNGAPTTATQSDDGWFGLGYGSDISAAIGVNMITPVELGIEEASTVEKIAAFPNPAVNMLTIPFNNKEGNATINIVDVTGKTVSTQMVNLTGVNNLKLDVTSIESGMYVFNVNYENGTASTFNVVINK
jgi:hypothetical protein